MAKTPKTYRFSELTLAYLDELKRQWPTCPETEIVERAIVEFLIHTRMANKAREKYE